MKRTKLWIGDQWIDARSSVRLNNPHTGEVLVEIGYASPAQAELAIETAAQAFESFREMPVYARSAILSRVAQIIGQRHEEAARIISEEGPETRLC